MIGKERKLEGGGHHEEKVEVNGFHSGGRYVCNAALTERKMLRRKGSSEEGAGRCGDASCLVLLRDRAESRHEWTHSDATLGAGHWGAGSTGEKCLP